MYTHFQVELSAKVPKLHCEEHLTVKLSANDPFVHCCVQKEVAESAHVYFFTPLTVILKKHRSKHNLVSLSPKVPGGQSSMQAFVALNP